MENEFVKEKSFKHIVILILGIISIAMGWLIPLIGYITSIIAIVMAVRKKAYKEDKKIRIGLIVAIIGIVLSLISHIFAVILLLTTL